MPVRKEKKSRISTPKTAAVRKKDAPRKNKTDAESLALDCERISQNRIPLPIIGIGASAGGLEAFKAFFDAMPADTGFAFVLVPHLDPTHVSIMPDLIQKHTEMQVLQIKDGMQVEPNTVYVVPPNQNLSILNSTLQLMELSQPRGAILPIDSFFRALARDQGPNAVGIILSGTGSDRPAW
jgi:two-component system CheB/CheR fusion protein